MQGEMTQDRSAEIEDACAEITSATEVAYAFLIERREAALAVAIAPLDAEKESLRQEYTEIGAEALDLQELLPSKARVAQAEHDRLLLAGDRAGAAARLAEQKAAESAPEAMRQRQQKIGLRLTAIEEEKKAQARRVFEVWYSEAQTIVRAAEHGLFIDLLDALRESFVEYEQRTDTGGTLTQPFSGLVQNRHLENLTSPDRSDSWVSGSRWYAGRTR
jgi:hypothetical protein